MPETAQEVQETQDQQENTGQTDSKMQAQSVEMRRSVAVVRVLGAHFDIRPGTSGLLFKALEQAGITVFSIATTITSSMCVIPDDQLEAAERVIGRTFDVPKKK